MKGIKHYKIFGSYYIDCDTTQYESVFFAFDGYWIEIPPETYVIDFGGNLCQFGLALSSEWLFGDTLFRSYYNVWDEDNGLVGFALRTGSYATTAITAVWNNEIYYVFSFNLYS